MQIEELGLWMPNVVKKTFLLKEDEFEMAFEKMREIEYEENIYRIGPIFYQTSEKDKNMKKREIIFYMPISEFPDNFPYDIENVLDVENTLLMRQADNEQSLRMARKKMEAYAKKQYNTTLSEISYLVCNDMYNEIFMDLYIPMLD